MVTMLTPEGPPGATGGRHVFLLGGTVGRSEAPA